MKNKLVAGVTATAFLITGCSPTSEVPQSSTAQAPETPSPPSNTPSSTVPSAAIPSATSNENDRGQLIKKLDEQASAGDIGGDYYFHMKVTDFEFIKCDGVYAKNMKGYVLAVSVEMQADKNFAGNDFIDNQENVMLTDYTHWTAYEPDGTKMTSLSGGDGIINCFDDGRKLFPDSISKGEKAKGQILLNVTTKTGEVAFDPYGFGGWVWDYPGHKANA